MGFVANLICFPAEQNFENRLRFDKVKESLKVGTVFETQRRNANSIVVVQCDRLWGIS